MAKKAELTREIPDKHVAVDNMATVHGQLAQQISDPKQRKMFSAIGNIIA